jgi:nicotinamidase-related amidase
MSHPSKMSPEDTALLVIDVQEKLMVKIPDAEALTRNIAFLVDAARLCDLPVWATEQYPKGLGPTVKDLADRLPQRPEKLAFSSCAVASVLHDLQHQGRYKIVLAGIEGHVCVLQTALDLLARGLQVYLPVDAIASRHAIDREMALRRLEQVGAVLTTSETCVFEWLGGADHSQFKPISRLVQDRMKYLSETGR